MSPDTLSQADTILLQNFATQLGITPSTLIHLAAHAIADHLRQTSSLTLPLSIGLPSPQCSTCPHSRAHPPATAPLHLLPFPRPQTPNQ